MKVALLILLGSLVLPGNSSVARAQEEDAPPPPPNVQAEPEAAGEPAQEVPVHDDHTSPDAEEVPDPGSRPHREIAPPEGAVPVPEAHESDEGIEEAPIQPAPVLPAAENSRPEASRSPQVPPNGEARRSRDSGRAPSASSPRRDSRPEARSDSRNRSGSRTSENPRPAASGSGSDFLAFKIITDRNIFDPTRSPRSTRPRVETRRPNQPAETFTLVGTLSYEAVAYAFFDGSRSEHKKAVEVGGQIGEYTVKNVGPTSVRLEAEGKVIDLPIGGQMRRTEEGWQLNSSSIASAASDSQSSSSSSTESSPDDESDIIKRLMQKREQEMGR